MKIVEQGHTIIHPNAPEGWEAACKHIELAGRIAYKSEDRITQDSYKRMIEVWIQRKHLAVIEFGHMTVHFVTDRGITHELVRHRLCSFVQESTRYCNYAKDKFGKELTFIKPGELTDGEVGRWIVQCEDVEKLYMSMIENKVSPQMARGILPNCVKTEIMVKANFREWQHIFQLRAINKDAHPDMRRLMIPLYEECRKACPIIFEMGDPL